MPTVASTIRPLTFRLAAAFVAVAAVIAPSSPAFASGRAITDALIWVGASERVARRSLDQRDVPAVRSVERRLGSPEDGRLDGGETRALMVAADKAREREGYRVVTDPATGARIGLPTAWLAGRRDVGNGSAWRSPDGAITVQTFVVPSGLDAFERIERRDISATYVAGQNRWRVVSGHAPGGRTVYARAVSQDGRRDGRAVGFRVAYETALGDRLDRVAVAMSSDFGVPDRLAPTEALAYAPPTADESVLDDGRFEPLVPRYAVLPEIAPAPRQRPRTESRVASLGTLRDVPSAVRGSEVGVVSTSLSRELPSERVVAAAPAAPAAPAAEPARAPRTDATPSMEVASREVATAPLSLDDDAGALELAPVRGGTPDDGRTENEIPQTITGFVTDEGQSCPTLRGPDGTLYALVGEVPVLEPGTLIEIEAVGVDTERCSAGRTVAVGGLRVRSTP